MANKALKTFKYLILLFLSLAVMAIIYAYIANLNRFSGLTGDDFLYHFVYTGEWPAKGGPRVYRNLFDWLIAIYNHMTLWNARLTSIIFEIAAMQFPKSVFNVVNTIAYLAVGLEINILASGKRALLQPIRLLLVYLLMWFFLSGFGSTVLWVSGAANYLWPTVLILAFFMPYRFNYAVKKHYNLMNWAIFILGVLTGMSNEVGSSTAILVVGCFTFMRRPKGTLNDFWWKLVGVTANLISFIVMLFLSTGSSESQTYGEKAGLVYHVSDIITSTVSNSGPLLLVIIILGAIVLFDQPNFLKKLFSNHIFTTEEKPTFSAVIFFVSALAGMGAMVISPVLFPRLWFAVNILLLVSLMNLFEAYQLLRTDKFFTTSILIIAAAALSFMAIPSYQIHLQDIKPFYNVFYTHDKLARAAHKNGEKIVKLPGIPVTDDLYNPYKGTPYIMAGNPKKQWANTWMAHYWGVEQIKLDNSIPVQISPQQDLPPIHTIQSWFQKHFSNVKIAEKLKLPNVTTTANYVVSIKNTVGQPAINTQLDNHNLPADKPWLRNALILYLDVTTNQIVGTEQITSPYYEKYDISHASLAGFETLAENPKSYYFTTAYDQKITIKVKRPIMHINVYFNRIAYDGDHKKGIRIATVKLNGRSGQIATLKSPNGYTFANDQKTKQLKISQQNSEKEIVLKKLPLKERLKAYRGYILLVEILGLWLVLDILFAVAQKQLEKHTEHKRNRKKKINSD